MNVEAPAPCLGVEWHDNLTTGWDYQTPLVVMITARTAELMTRTMTSMQMAHVSLG